VKKVSKWLLYYTACVNITSTLHFMVVLRDPHSKWRLLPYTANLTYNGHCVFCEVGIKSLYMLWKDVCLKGLC
jgi:hypothetical protein